VFHTLTAEIPMQANNNMNGEMFEHVTICTTLNSLLIHIRYECSCESKCTIAMAKAAFNKKRALFTSTLDLELRKKLVKCYVWSIALYGAET